MMIQNLQDTAKNSPKEVYSNIILGNKKKTQVNNITLHLRQLKKEEQNKPKVSRRKKKITNIRAEINEIQTKTVEKISENKIWFFEMINLISLQLESSNKKRLINKIRNEKEVTTDTVKMQRTIKDYNEQLFANKMDHLEEMGKF